MKEQIFKGLGVAIATPFCDDGSVNYEAFGRHIEFLIQNSTDCIVVCGTTGEASTMTDEEHLDVIEYCVKQVAGRIHVMAGTGSNDTRHVVELSREAQNRGANSLLQVTPYYNKTNQSGLVRHFTAVADAVDIPIVLYNVPARTGMSIAPATYKELAQHPRIVATKEASGDIAHIANVMEACNGEMGLYSGNDDQILPLLSLGGLGVISVVGNVAPKATKAVCDAWFAGNPAQSLTAQLALLPLNNAFFSDVNPIPVKEAMNMLGFEAGPCRLPLGQLGNEKKVALQNALQNAGLL